MIFFYENLTFARGFFVRGIPEQRNPSQKWFFRREILLLRRVSLFGDSPNTENHRKNDFFVGRYHFYEGFLCSGISLSPETYTKWMFFLRNVAFTMGFLVRGFPERGNPSRKWFFSLQKSILRRVSLFGNFLFAGNPHEINIFSTESSKTQYFYSIKNGRA